VASAAPADHAAPLLRRGLLALAGLTALGIAVELAADRHWTQPLQLVAWGALVALAAAIALLVGRATPRRIRLARLLAAAVLISAVLGIWGHVHANYEAGPLDFQFAESWDGLDEATRWWLALTKTVGPSPLFASGALAQAALCLLLASLRHPALGAGAPAPPACQSGPAERR
jgi:hypothetical protein